MSLNQLGEYSQIIAEELNVHKVIWTSLGLTWQSGLGFPGYKEGWL